MKKHPKNIWHYDAEALALNYYNEDGNFYVGIDLERCRTTAEVLDWIIQAVVGMRSTDAVVGGLVRALNDLLRPQSTLCSGGEDQGPLDVKALLKDTTSHDFPIGGGSNGLKDTTRRRTPEGIIYSTLSDVAPFHARTATQALNDPLPDPIKPRVPKKPRARR